MNLNTNLKTFSIFLVAIVFTLITIVFISGRSNQVSNLENNRVNEMEDVREIDENSQEMDSSEAEGIITDQTMSYPYTEYQFILEFYQNISNKNYEAAYAVAPLGRTFEEFVSIYNGVERILPSYIEVINGLFRLRVEVANSSNEVFYYDVVMDIQQKDDSTYYISKAESNQLENLYYLDNTSFPDRIEIKQTSTNRTAQTDTYLYQTDPARARIIPGKIVDNSQYLITFGGAAAMTQYGVFLYNNSTNTINLVEVFEVWPLGNETDENGNFAAVKCEDFGFRAGTDPDLTPCMLQYKDTDWYKNNLEAKNELPKYIFNDL